MAGWKPQKTAPRATEVTIRTKAGKEFRASWDWADDGDEGECIEWAALDESDAPDCWTDGICWAFNADGEQSDPVVEWKH